MSTVRKPTACNICNRFPIRREQDLWTWFECSKCGIRGPRFNEVSDNFAYQNSLEAWNQGKRLHIDRSGRLF